MSVADESRMAGLGALEAAVNGYLRQAPDTLRRLGRLAGRVVAVELITAPQTPTPPEVLARVFVLPGGDGIALLAEHAGPADTTLRGTPLGLARLGLGEDSFGSVFKGAVQIEGDIELGQQFKRALDGMQFDWEEWLSRLVGDAAAHRAGHATRGTSRWVEQTREALGRNAAEYLQEELRLLPTRAELEAWLHEVDTARDDCARLEARIARLQARRREPPADQG